MIENMNLHPRTQRNLNLLHRTKEDTVKQQVKETHLIRIKSKISRNDDSENIELTTRGSYVFKNGNYFITYAETETTGFAGTTTMVKVAQDESRVAMLRFGKTASQLLIQRGQRNLCHYETGVGSMTLGVTANEIASDLSEDGGTVRFDYMLDAGTADLMSQNGLEITVTPLS